MKKALLVTFVFLLTFSISYSQKTYKKYLYDYQYNFYDAVKEADQYYETHQKGKGSGFKPYMRWKIENESKYYPTGDRSNVDPYFVSQAYKEFLVNNSSASFKSSPVAGWRDLGPYSASNITEGYNPGIGRIEAIWIDPNDPQHLFLGSRSGGFWKTDNEGASWENTTDFLFASGVNTITVNPFNSNEVLINVRNANNGTTHGIHRSLDGGDTWVLSNFNPGNLGFGGLGDNQTIRKIVYHPSVANLVVVATSEGLYVSYDNLNSWTVHFSPSTYIDVEFHPTNNNIIYAYGSGDVVRRSIDQGLSFTDSNAVPGNDGSKGFLAVTPEAPDNLYFASSKGIWKSTDTGINFTFLENPEESCQGFAISDLDSLKMIYGYVDVHASTDETTFTQTTFWANSNPDNSYIHADLRTAECVNGIFYVGTDGYMCKSADNGQTWTRLSDGTSVRETYAFGLSQSDHQTMIGGSQDNGTSIYYKGSWIEWNGGDGMEALIHPLNEDWMIGSWQYGTRNRTKDGGQTRNVLGAPQSGSGQAYWVAPMFFDPNDHMRIFHCSDSLFVSNDFGSNWQYLGTPDIGQIEVGAIAENNSDIIALADGSDLRLSIDGGLTYSDIESNLPNHSITDIAFSPTDDNTIIVTFNRYQNDGEKIFISDNLGQSWTNITHNLGNMPIRDVVIDHSADNIIYIGAEIGVYYKTMSSNTWTLYNQDLPNVTIRELEINYGTNTLVGAAWGRGYWEYDLLNRSSFPSVLSTDVTYPPTDTAPLTGQDQLITSVISYTGTLTNVIVIWSSNNTSFSDTINMSNVSDSTWVADSVIPSLNIGDKIYFKVIATGNNNDTSETYKYMYSIQSDCYFDLFDVTINPCSDNGTSNDPADDYYTFNIEVDGVNSGATYSISGDININNLSYGVSNLIDNGGAGFAIGTTLNITITDDNDSFCFDNTTVQSPGNCFNPNPTCALSDTIQIPGTFSATGPSIGNGAINSNADHANWFVFTAPTDAEVVVSSCLKGKDTRVWVYEGDCNNLNLIANNDDICEMTSGSSAYASEVTFCVVKNEEYFIEWDDRWSDDPFDFDVTMDSTLCIVSCNITDANVIKSACNDNGTQNNILDDFYNISLDPAGNGLGISYTISGDFNAANISYGSVYNIPDNLIIGPDFNITITDDSDANCSFNINQSSPDYCSLCIYDTGNLPPTTSYVCFGDSVIVSTNSSMIADSISSLVYVMHLNSSFNANEVVAVSANGVFSNNNTITAGTYYVSAVVANTFDSYGMPDFNSNCIGISSNHVTVNFISEINLSTIESCDDYGNQSVVINISGGGPSIFGGNFSLYIPENNFFSSVQPNIDFNYLITSGISDYTLNISDNFPGCAMVLNKINDCIAICTDTLIINNYDIISNTYQSEYLISTEGNILNNNQVILHSGSMIELKQIFNCEPNAELHIYIDGCNNN